MKAAWVMGWATPRVWFASIVEAVFPNEEHVFIASGPDTWTKLECNGPYDTVVGYSLGSQLLLENPERVASLAREITLLAPIFAFPKEAGLGGKIARSQVLYLARWLRRDLAAALADFSFRAGLDLPTQTLGETDRFCLEWGLKRLEVGEVKPPAPSGWRLYCGDGDSLLDAQALADLDPAVSVVPGATHHPTKLLEAWARSGSVVAGGAPRPAWGLELVETADPGDRGFQKPGTGVSDPGYSGESTGYNGEDLDP